MGAFVFNIFLGNQLVFFLIFIIVLLPARSPSPLPLCTPRPSCSYETALVLLMGMLGWDRSVSAWGGNPPPFRYLRHLVLHLAIKCRTHGVCQACVFGQAEGHRGNAENTSSWLLPLLPISWVTPDKSYPFSWSWIYLQESRKEIVKITVLVIIYVYTRWSKSLFPFVRMENNTVINKQ